MKEENEGKSVIENTDKVIDFDGSEIAAGSLTVNSGMIKTIKLKNAKDPKKVIAALRGEITKKQKEIDILKKVRDYENEDFKQRGDEIRFLTNRNLWQRIINKEYSIE